MRAIPPIYRHDGGSLAYVTPDPMVVLVAAVAAIEHTGGWSAILSANPAQAGKMSIISMVALGTAKWMQGQPHRPI